MVVTKIRGGLGNQLFTYAAGRCLSALHGAPLLLDTSWYRPGRRPLMLRHFNVKGEFSDQDRSGAEDGIGFNQQHWNCYPRFFDFAGYRFLSGWWQSERFFEPAAALIRQDLTFADPAVSAAVGKELQSTRDQHRGPLVSMHCRRGDYVNLSARGKFVLLSASYYHDAMSCFPQNSTFLLFSDDPEWCRGNLVDPRIVLCEIEDALTAFGVMMRCDHHIIANSSFSWWAAWLGEGEGKIIVAPEQAKWFGPVLAASYDMTGIVPARWTQVPLRD
jgi:hypothetical protein